MYGFEPIKYKVNSPAKFYEEYPHQFTIFFGHGELLKAQKEVVRRLKMGVPAWIIEVI